MGGDRVLHRLGLVAAIASTCVIGSKVALSQTPKKGGTFFLGRTRRSVASSSKAGRTHSQVLTALRASSRATDRFRARDQSQDRQDARPHDPAIAARPRRRGDRIGWRFAAVHESLPGTKEKRSAPQRFRPVCEVLLPRDEATACLLMTPEGRTSCRHLPHLPKEVAATLPLAPRARG
jgi:hypothetical protein